MKAVGERQPAPLASKSRPGADLSAQVERVQPRNYVSVKEDK
jgi:hypothetical protein